MSDIAIRAEGLSKRYRIGGVRAPYRTLRESLMNAATMPLRRARAVLRGQSAVESTELIWALKDVSFEVKHGEVLGIIGPNGAGKTTLLRVLSRITKPTEGYAELRGRVGSLLEVGTGFHPELTGRENVYLSGAILGMAKAEIESKFDEIVAFAEIEKFLETPVKHYSYGMYVRLAFAVAAHLEPEILLVDEVLAVGDAAFQQKCIGKMGELALGGRTVLFVSHNMDAVKRLCSTALLLDRGRVRHRGATESVVRAYRADPGITLADSSVHSQIDQLAPDDRIRLVDVVVGDSGGKEYEFRHCDPIPMSVAYEITLPTQSLRVGFNLYTIDGTLLFESFDDDSGPVERREGLFSSNATIPPYLLNKGRYLLAICVMEHMTGWIWLDKVTIPLEVVDTSQINWRFPSRRRDGLFLIDPGWQVLPVARRLADEKAPCPGVGVAHAGSRSRSRP